MSAPHNEAAACRPRPGVGAPGRGERLRYHLCPMKTTFLDFEQPIAELEQKIEELRFVQDDSAVDISQEIERLSKKSRELTKEIYGKLTPWQIAQVARHPQRPYTLDYVARACSPTSRSCTATAPSPTTRRSWAASRASTAQP